MTDAIDIEGLKERLGRLGVQIQAASTSAPSSGLAASQEALRHSPRPQSRNARAPGKAAAKPQVAELLDRINTVEAGLRTAEALNMAAASRAGAEAHSAAVAELRKGGKSPEPRPSRARQTSAAGAAGPSAAGGSRSKPKAPAPPLAIRASVGLPKGAVGRAADILRGIPEHTPLSSVLHQYKEAETTWAHDKAQLRREAEEQRKRAVKAEAELRRLARLAEHRSLDIKALKSALKNRDAQLEAATERIKELELLVARTQDEGAVRAATLTAERDDCKALLLATLQRLEAVDEVVHRADVSSAMMQDKMKALEEERLRALEAAARARAEVAELTESRRKLQWQSKLLEKMSEVQLRHNARKSEAIKKILTADNPAGVDAASYMSTADTDVGAGLPAAAASPGGYTRELREILARAGAADGLNMSDFGS